MFEAVFSDDSGFCRKFYEINKLSPKLIIQYICPEDKNTMNCDLFDPF